MEKLVAGRIVRLCSQRRIPHVCGGEPILGGMETIPHEKCLTNTAKSFRIKPKP